MKTTMRSLDDVIADIDHTRFPAHDVEAPTGALSDARQFIRFTLDDFIMAAPIEDTLEIGRHPVITALPNLPGWLLGISNVRGEIISMVDLKAFFNIARPAVRRNARFIILHNSLFKVGIMVDRILGIFSHSLSGTDGSPPFPPDDSLSKSSGWTMYIREVIPLKEGVLNILDIQRLLASPAMNTFSSQ